MPLKFCANLSFMFQEASLLIDRYNLARNAGFKAVECANPYDYDIKRIVKCKELSGVKQILINTPVDQEKKELGYAALGELYEDKFLKGVFKAIEYAKALECPLIHIMSGIVEKPTRTNFLALIKNLKFIKPLLEEASVTGVIEGINPHSLPNYFLNSYDSALEVIREVDSPNIRLQLDIFHLQHIKGDLTFEIKKLLPYTSHIQIAQVPGRNEPNTLGEINYGYVFTLLEEMSYPGYIGLEYHPLRSTIEGLVWIEEFGFTLND